MAILIVGGVAAAGLYIFGLKFLFGGILTIVGLVIREKLEKSRATDGVVAQFAYIFISSAIIWGVSIRSLGVFFAGAALGTWAAHRVQSSPSSIDAYINPEAARIEEQIERKNWYLLSLFEKRYAPTIRTLGFNLILISAVVFIIEIFRKW